VLIWPKQLSLQQPSHARLLFFFGGSCPPALLALCLLTPVVAVPCAGRGLSSSEEDELSCICFCPQAAALAAPRGLKCEQVRVCYGATCRRPRAVASYEGGWGWAFTLGNAKVESAKSTEWNKEYLQCTMLCLYVVDSRVSLDLGILLCPRGLSLGPDSLIELALCTGDGGHWEH